MNKTQAVLEHIKKRGHITPWAAIENYGETRLAAKIFILRRRGYNIETVMKNGRDRFGNPCTYADYVLEEASDE